MAIVFERGLALVVHGAGHPRDGLVARPGDQIDPIAVLPVVFLHVQQIVLVRIAQRGAGIDPDARKDLDGGDRVVVVIFGAQQAAQRIQTVFDFPSVRQAVAIVILGADRRPRAGPEGFRARPLDLARESRRRVGNGGGDAGGVVGVLVVERHVAEQVVLGLLQITRCAFQDAAGDSPFIGAKTRTGLQDEKRLFAGYVLELALGERPRLRRHVRPGPRMGQQGMQAFFAEIGQAVVIRVGMAVIGVAQGLGFDRIESRPRFFEGVQQPVAVRVAVERVRPAKGIECNRRKRIARFAQLQALKRKVVGFFQFLLGGQAVAVDVHVRMPQRLHRIAGGIDHLDRIQRIGVVVDEAVVEGIHARVDFHRIFQFVAVGVAVARIGFRHGLQPIGHAVAIVVEILRIRAEAQMQPAGQQRGVAGVPARAPVEGRLPAVEFVAVHQAVEVHVVRRFIAGFPGQVGLARAGVDFFFHPAVGQGVIEVGRIKPGDFRLARLGKEDARQERGSPQNGLHRIRQLDIRCTHGNLFFPWIHPVRHSHKPIHSGAAAAASFSRAAIQPPKAVRTCNSTNIACSVRWTSSSLLFTSGRSRSV